MSNYVFVNVTKHYEGHVLHRIIAVEDYPQLGVKKGDLGGWIEKEENLRGDAWVADDAVVCGNADVRGHAVVRGYAEVSDYAKVNGNAHVSGSAKVRGNSKVIGNAVVCGNVVVSDCAEVSDDAYVSGCAVLSDYAKVRGYANVCGKTEVRGKAVVKGNAKIKTSGVINKTTDYLTIGPLGSRNDYTTFYKAKYGIGVSCGCFSGTINEFRAKVKETHGDSRTAREYLETADFAEKKLMDSGEGIE